MPQPSALLALYASFFFFFLILCPSDQKPGKLVAIGRYWLPTTGPSLLRSNNRHRSRRREGPAEAINQSAHARRGGSALYQGPRQGPLYKGLS